MCSTFFRQLKTQRYKATTDIRKLLAENVTAQVDGNKTETQAFVSIQFCCVFNCFCFDHQNIRCQKTSL